MSLETEIEGYKKSIQKEQEQNEKLTFVHNKTEVDIATVKKILQQVQDKHDTLKNEYATYTRMLNETEQALGRANTVIINVKCYTLNNISQYLCVSLKENLEKNHGITRHYEIVRSIKNSPFKTLFSVCNL